MTGLFKFVSSIKVLSAKLFTTEVDNPSFFETIGTIITTFFTDILTHVLTLFTKLIYTIVKWMMVVIDFAYTIVRQLIGIGSDSSGTSFLIKDDIIFQFLSGDGISTLLKYMLGFCLVILIIFTIIAIVKSEYDYTVYGTSNDKKQVLAKSLRAVFLMILVPFIVIGSIIASNALLRTLSMATSGDGSSTSIGTQIYLSSSYRANAYRYYADSNKKIPITYNFDPLSEDEEIKIAGWEAEGGVQEIDKVVEEYMNMSVWTRGQMAFNMFYNNDYFDIDYIDDITYRVDQKGEDPEAISIYEGFYDNGIRTYRPEYYVMADVIEEFFGTGTEIYFKTLEEVYESDPDTAELYGIQPDKDNTVYTMTVKYNYDFDGDNEADTITYTHTARATDEAEGAVFICTTKAIKEVGGTNKAYFIPILQNHLYGKNADFFPSYIDSSLGEGKIYPVIARGTFTEDGYPTAIRQKNGVVECYRDNLNVPTLIDFFPTISYEKPIGATEGLGSWVLRSGFELITGVNPDNLIPYVYYNFDIFNLFSKTTNVITTLTDGLSIDYYFSDTDIAMENLYWIPRIDIVILLFSTCLVFSIIFKAMIGLIGRIFDIVMLVICYPATLALFPMKGDGTFSKWSAYFISRLVGAYGIIIALNLMFVFTEIADGFLLLESGDAANSWIVSILSVDFANVIFKILFLLVAYTMLKELPGIINELISDNAVKTEDIISRGANPVADLKKVAKFGSSVVSGKIVVDTVKEVKSSIPGGAVVAKGKQKYSELQHLSDVFIGEIAKGKSEGTP